MESTTIVAIINSGLTVMVGILMVIVIYHQKEVEKNKLKFSLYEKRYAIYDFIKFIIHEIIANHEYNRNINAEYNKKMNESKFLFNDEIFDHMKELKRKALRVEYLQKQIYGSKLSVVDSKKIADEISELDKWFTDEHLNLENRFIDYLGFRNLK
jgi:hypothetical protein